MAPAVVSDDVHAPLREAIDCTDRAAAIVGDAVKVDDSAPRLA